MIEEDVKDHSDCNLVDGRSSGDGDSVMTLHFTNDCGGIAFYAWYNQGGFAKAFEEWLFRQPREDFE